MGMAGKETNSLAWSVLDVNRPETNGIAGVDGTGLDCSIIEGIRIAGKECFVSEMLRLKMKSRNVMDGLGWNKKARAWK